MCEHDEWKFVRGDVALRKRSRCLLDCSGRSREIERTTLHQLERLAAMEWVLTR